jgi:hypothetical protein
MKPQGKWVEYWLYPTEDVTKDCAELDKERHKNNMAKSIPLSRSILAYQVSQLKAFQTFLKRFPVELTQEEMESINDDISKLDKRMKGIAYREAARQAGDLACALCAGMRRICNEDFVDLSAQSLFWFLFRLSPYASNGGTSPIVAWASCYNRIAFEATSTGPAQQKNKIVGWSLDQCDRFWKNSHGTPEVLEIQRMAEEGGLDVTECLWSIANLCKTAYSKVKLEKSLTKADHAGSVEHMFLEG